MMRASITSFGCVVVSAVVVKLAVSKLLRRHTQKNLKLDFNEDGPITLSIDQLTFLSLYTGITDLKSLREFVIGVWQDVKEKQHVYCCIQAMSFLKPKVQDHPKVRLQLQPYMRNSGMVDHSNCS